MGAVARRASPAGLGDADLDQAGLVSGRLVIGGGGQFPCVGPGCGLAGGSAGGRAAAGGFRAGGGDGEQGLGAHGQHGVAVEGVPGADLVLVQAGLAFSLLEAFFAGHLFPATEIRTGRDAGRPCGAWQ